LQGRGEGVVGADNRRVGGLLRGGVGGELGPVDAQERVVVGGQARAQLAGGDGPGCEGVNGGDRLAAGVGEGEREGGFALPAL
jgi:hypothetical protein